MDEGLDRQQRRAAIWRYGFPLVLLLSLLTKSVYFQFASYLNSMPLTGQGNPGMLFSNMAVIAALFAILLLLSKRSASIAVFTAYMILIVILAIDTNFIRYYGHITSVQLISSVNFKVIGNIGDSVSSLFKLSDVIYIADIPVIVFLLIRYRNLLKVRIAPGKRLIVPLTAIFVSAAVLLLVYMTLDKDVYSRRYLNSNYTSGRLGVFSSHFINIGDCITGLLGVNGNKQDDIDKVSQYFKERQADEAGYTDTVVNGITTAGVSAGKNLIVIQVEALQEFVIGAETDGRMITPNLNALVSRSAYFDNIYTQVADGNTSDAEFLLNTSLYPIKEGAVFIRYAQNDYKTLPKVLKSKGYHTDALHAFTAEFWNRTAMYKALDFDRFINSDYFTMDEFAGWDGNALSDTSFFRQSLRYIDTTRPFYNFYITLCSHHPYIAFKDYPFDVGKYEGTMLGNYFKAMHFEDESIGLFLEGLKAKGVYDDTLIVIYGDHTAIPRFQSEEVMDFLGMKNTPFNWFTLSKVPLIIHGPGLPEGRVFNKTGGEIDIFPTISHLMDLQTPYTLGRNLFDPTPGYAVTRNSSIFADDFVYLSDSGIIYNAQGVRIKPDQSIEDRLAEYLKGLEISDIMIKRNIAGDSDNHSNADE